MLKPVRDNEYGVYLWKKADGKYFSNDSGEFLSIPARYGDLRMMKAIGDAARYYGVFEGGRAEFISGARQVSSNEYDDQMERMLDGKTPDPYDVGALRDELAEAKSRG